MKKFIFYFVTATIAIGMSTSCTKPQPASVTPSAGSVSVTINATPWTATTLSLLEKNPIQVSCTDNDGNRLSLFMPDTTSVGKHNLDFFNYSIIYNSSKGGYAMKSGSYMITSNSGNIVQGTFSATGANTSNSSDVTSLSNGAFTINY